MTTDRRKLKPSWAQVDKEEFLWALQITDAHGEKRLLLWIMFPFLYDQWAKIDDDESAHIRPSVQFFRFKREAIAARKKCFYRNAKIVRVKITIDVLVKS